MAKITKTGLPPQWIDVDPEHMSIITEQNPRHGLRPELFESLYYLFRATRNPKWKEYGWRLFESMTKHAQLPNGGFVRVRDVHTGAQGDAAPAHLFGGTLKYAYLLFSAEHAIDLNEVVFNTEAHPFTRIDRLDRMNNEMFQCRKKLALHEQVI